MGAAGGALGVARPGFEPLQIVFVVLRLVLLQTPAISETEDVDAGRCHGNQRTVDNPTAHPNLTTPFTDKEHRTVGAGRI